MPNTYHLGPGGGDKACGTSPVLKDLLKPNAEHNMAQFLNISEPSSGSGTSPGLLHKIFSVTFFQTARLFI